MPRRDDAPRDLLFGLLALQNGMITRDQLVAAFGAWTASDRPMADLLVEYGALSGPRRTLLEALAAEHLAAHDGDPEKSLAALDLNRSTRESLASAGGPAVEATLAHVGSGSGPNGPADVTASYAVGTATSDGQRFRVLRPHARGGLGAVFVALDGELNREVALKQILDHHADDPVSRQRFLVEAEITGGLEHPGIVPVYGLGTYHGGRPYYAMRFVKGDSLKEAIERFHSPVGSAVRTESSPETVRTADPTGNRSLELRRLLRRFLDVCNAIEYAHSRGVLHRDLKPGNVIVGRHGETLVVDWGLAKPLGRVESAQDSGERTLMLSSASGSAETLPGSVLGTPAYMSPEQAAGDLEKLGPRSDVYSLGATLYCLLTGKAPFEGDVFEVLCKVQEGEFAPPRQLDPSIDQALEAVCLKAMATRPEDRYGSCKALAEDVDRWAADEMVAAWKEPWTRTLQRWLTRHRTGVTGAAAAGLVGVVGLVGVLAVQARANGLLAHKNAQLVAANTELDRQRARAVTAEGNARRQADELEKVSRFQSQMLAQLDPARAGLGLIDDVRMKFEQALAKAAVPADERARQVDAFASQWGRVNATDAALTLIDETILKPAVAAIDRDLKDQPLIAASLRQTLGERYKELGLYAAAASLLEQALKTRREALGPAHRDALTSLTSLAALRHLQGKPAEGLALAREALDTGRRTLGRDDPATLEALTSAGTLLLDLGKADEAIPLHREALDGWRRARGADSSEAIGALADLAMMLGEHGKLDDSIRDLREVVAWRRRVLGEEHPETLTALKNLGVNLNRRGDLAEAVDCFREVMEKRRRVLGDVHPGTLSARSDLGGVLSGLGRHAEAEALMRQTLAETRRILGADHPDVIAPLNNLAVFLIQRGRLDEAEPLCLESLERLRRVAGPEHPHTLIGLNVLSFLYRTRNEPEKAEPLLREALGVSRRVNGPDHPDTLIFARNHGSALLSLGKLDEAEPLVRDTADRALRTLGAKHPITVNTRVDLGGLLIRLRRDDEAAALLIAAEAPAREARNPVLALLLQKLGAARAGLNQFQTAEEALLESHATYLRNRGEAHAETRSAARALVDLYRAWHTAQPAKGYDAKAAEWSARLGLLDLPANVFARP